MTKASPSRGLARPLAGRTCAGGRNGSKMFNFRVSRTGRRTLASSVLVASLLHSTALHAASPELPRQVVDTAMPTPTGKTITVSAGGDFQAALNTAALGDVIVLQAGATYSGPFTLPNKSGSGWIIVRSSSASLPAPGTRVGPADAANLAKILAPSDSTPAVQTVAGAHHYRFIGIEFTSS